jgi:ubiquinone/menaquinone biosynthesis C-methylase UbiE
LEHIDAPEKYFSEAVRVVKKGGHILVCAPFIFRMHGGEPEHRMDYCRYLNGFFYKVAADNCLDIVEIYSNTGYGTTFASLTNQFLIRKIIESNWIVKIILFPISPLVFFVSNTLGFLIDTSPDARFSTRFHVKFRKV